MKQMLTYFLYTTIFAFSLPLSAMEDGSEKVGADEVAGLDLMIEGKEYHIGTFVHNDTPVFLVKSAETGNQLRKIDIDDPVPGNPKRGRGLHLFALSSESKWHLCKAIERGATVDIEDVYGCVPLIWAIMEKNSVGALGLINRGAAVKRPTAFGLMPLDLAEIQGLSDVIVAIKEKGGGNTDKTLEELMKEDILCDEEMQVLNFDETMELLNEKLKAILTKVHIPYLSRVRALRNQGKERLIK